MGFGGGGSQAERLSTYTPPAAVLLGPLSTRSRPHHDKLPFPPRASTVFAGAALRQTPMPRERAEKGRGERATTPLQLHAAKHTAKSNNNSTSIPLPESERQQRLADDPPSHTPGTGRATSPTGSEPLLPVVLAAAPGRLRGVRLPRGHAAVRHVHPLVPLVGPPVVVDAQLLRAISKSKPPQREPRERAAAGGTEERRGEGGNGREGFSALSRWAGRDGEGGAQTTTFVSRDRETERERTNASRRLQQIKLAGWYYADAGNNNSSGTEPTHDEGARERPWRRKGRNNENERAAATGSKSYPTEVLYGKGPWLTVEPCRPLIFPGSQLFWKSFTSTSAPVQSSKLPGVAGVPASETRGATKKRKKKKK